MPAAKCYSSLFDAYITAFVASSNRFVDGEKQAAKTAKCFGGNPRSDECCREILRRLFAAGEMMVLVGFAASAKARLELVVLWGVRRFTALPGCAASDKSRVHLRRSGGEVFFVGGFVGREA